jgi:hypothetical protein
MLFAAVDELLDALIREILAQQPTDSFSCEETIMFVRPKATFPDLALIP